MKNILFSTLLLILFANTGLSQTTITDSTTVSGLWTAASSPYVIEGRAIIPEGETLEIAPGVTVKFTSSASPTPSWFDYTDGNVGVIRVMGELIANGTPENPIVFTRNNSGYWGTILLDAEASPNSSLTNCIVEYAKESRNIPGIDSPMAFIGGVSVYQSSLHLENNTFRHNRNAGVYIREVNANMMLSENTLHNNGSNGLVIEQSEAQIVNNIFYENSNTSSGAVSAIRSSGSTTFITGNLIYDNDDFGIHTTEGGSHYLVNNTIYNNYQGLRVENGANTYIYNCIIQNNSQNFATSFAGDADVEVHYSLTDDSSLPDNVISVEGNILSGNANFVNAGSGNFALQAGSSAIDAGDSDTTGLFIPETDILGNPRIDSEIIDMGATEYQQPTIYYSIELSASPASGGEVSGSGTYEEGTIATITATPAVNYVFLNWTEDGDEVSENPEYTFSVDSDRDLQANFELSVGIDTEPQTTTEIYPNPTSGVLHIDSDGFQLARLYSLDGRMMIESRENIVDLSSLCKGVYLLKVTTSENVIFTSKIIKE